MDHINDFEILVDITEVEVLYDYVECKEYRRPASGKWDLSVFSGKGTLDCVHEDDENGQFRVELMDKAIADTKCLEKKIKKEKQDQNVNASDVYFFDAPSGTRLPRRIIPFFNPGDTIKGTVVLDLKKAMPAAKLVVGFMGRSYVIVWYYNQYGAHYMDKSEVYVQDAIPLWQHIDDKMDDLAEEFKLLSRQESVTKGTELRAGAHSYPFEFHIPLDARQSTPPLVLKTDDKGHIVYRLKAVIDKGKLLSWGNISTHKGIWVKGTMDIASDPKNLGPVAVEEVLETGQVAFWKSGSITVRVKLDRIGVLIGEEVPITLEIYNESKGKIDSISSCIRMHGKARTGQSKLSYTTNINIKSVKVKEGPLEAGISQVYRWKLPWDFSESSSDGNLLPVGHLDDSNLLDIKYEVRVKLTRKGLHRNVELSVPITVGNVNSASQN